MKKYLPLLFIIPIAIGSTLCIMPSAYSQNPLVKQWDARFGGKQNDELFSFQQTADGGYILGGYSLSGISGDKTQPSQGSMDYWVVKTDAIGVLQWEKTFGGSSNDVLQSLQQTADHGYVLGGYSVSPLSGDKSQATQGMNDYWVLKLDSTGNKIWDKDFGGNDVDYLFSLQQTPDGGYILGGSSSSQAGGDKSQNTWASSYDYWIIKLDSSGIKQWDKDFGGNAIDELHDIRQTADGGYILAGISSSGIGGDKTQASFGDFDYWLIKTDASGNKLWDASFGGANADALHSIQPTSDHGFIFGGVTYSGISGNKTTPIWGVDGDYWIVKTDSLGTKQWEKDFGGIDNEDDFGSVFQTNDLGYLFAGTSYSGITGDKTESNLGGEQTWIIKTDSLGNKVWDKTIFTTGHDESGYAIQTNDGCYAIANWDNGGIGGYRSQDNWDTLISVSTAGDYWIVKFCDSTLVPQAAFTAANHTCPGTCVNFTNLSMNATSYQWFFTGATPPFSTDANPQNICYSNPGSYDVTLIASDANGSDTLTLSNYIIVYPFPPPQGITQSGDTLFANAGSASYQWYFNGNIIPGATDYFYLAQAGGDYNVVATDANGCEVEAAIFNVIAGLQETKGNWQLAIFPNPVGNKFTIHNLQFTSKTAVEISIFNMLGEKIYWTLDGGMRTDGDRDIDCRYLPPGMYWIRVSSGDKTLRSKFIKQ